MRIFIATTTTLCDLNGYNLGLAAQKDPSRRTYMSTVRRDCARA